MKNFKVTVIRTDEYDIAVDETVWNAAVLADWSKTFYEVSTLKELAKDIGGGIMYKGTGAFLEGFGYLKTLNSNGDERKRFVNNRDGKLVEAEYAQGITVRIIDEDEGYQYDVEELLTENIAANVPDSKI